MCIDATLPALALVTPQSATMPRPPGASMSSLAAGSRWGSADREALREPNAGKDDWDVTGRTAKQCMAHCSQWAPAGTSRQPDPIVSHRHPSQPPLPPHPHQRAGVAGRCRRRAPTPGALPAPAAAGSSGGRPPSWVPGSRGGHRWGREVPCRGRCVGWHGERSTCAMPRANKRQL